MEWEFVHGVLIGDVLPQSPLTVSVKGPTGAYVKSIPLATLGLAGWELVNVVEYRNDLIVFFKRQKLYAVGNEIAERAMLDW